MADDIEVMERTVIKNGWRAERTGGNHRRWISPEGARVIVSMTPSDRFREAKNVAKEMRRYGYNVDGTKVPDAQFLATQQKLAREVARIEQLEREERSVTGRLTQALADTPNTPVPDPADNIGELLDHELLQFDVIDGPPPSYKPWVLAGEVATAPRQQAPTVAMTTPEVPVAEQEKKMATEFSVESLLQGAVVSTPRSQTAEVWHEVFEKISSGQWFKMPGEFTLAQCQAAQKVARDEIGWKVKSEGSITSTNRTLWLRKDV